MAMNSSNIFENIFSVLSRSGSPLVYRLSPKKEKIGNVTRLTLGKKSLTGNETETKQTNKTILLVGETGAGKSTLINALVNFAMGVKWEDNVWFEIAEERTGCQSESQTSDVTVYEIFGFEGKTLPYTLTIIDTPGYGDTRGNNYDDIISERLLELFSSEGGVHKINAVGLVLKATLNRLSDRHCYIFNNVLSLFGRDMVDSIVVLVTHSSGRKPVNVLQALEAAKFKCAKDAKSQPVYFLFDNCQTEDREDDPDVLEHADKITMKGMTQFADFLSKSEPKSLQMTVEVMNKRMRLKVCIKNLRERIKFLEERQPGFQRLFGSSYWFLRHFYFGWALIEKYKWLEESFQHVLSLERIALNADSLSTHVHLDLLIKTMEERGGEEELKKLKDIKRRVDYGIQAGMSCCENKTMAMNNIFKFDNITSKMLIRPGSPAVYKLIPNVNAVGTVTTMTLGKKDTTKLNKTILLVGETGTGKSTLINALVNYTMGVKWEDNVWFEIVEEKKNSQCVSQTSDVAVYEIFGFEDKTLPYSLTIIDTPGYGDTGGISHDDVVSQRLLELFRSEGGVNEINAVGLVLKSSMNRLDDRQSYIFNSVLSLFARNMEDSIVALITHSTGRKPANVLDALEAAKIKCAKNAKSQPVYFLFDNCQTEDREDREDDLDALEHADRITMKGMKQFAEFLSKSVPKRLQVTVDVLNERERLKVCIKNLRDRVEFIESKQREIREKKEALMKHKEEIERNKDFKIQTTEVYKDKEDYEGGRRWYTLWLAKSGTLACIACEENCHDPCSVAWSKGGCEFIKKDHCTVCTGKCHKSRHVKESWRYVTKTRTVSQTCAEMKSKYEEGKAGQAKAEGLLETLQKVMEELQKDKDKWLEESFQHVAKLEQIALNVDSLSIHEHLDFLIKRMEEKADEEKVNILKEMKARVDKGIQAGIRYKGVGEMSMEMD